MVDVVLERLDPDEADFVGAYRVKVAAQAVDMPDEEPVTVKSVTARYRGPLPGMGPALHWLGRLDGEVVATATALLPADENDGLAVVELIVHPLTRRQGVGTAVLRALLPELTARGRVVLVGTVTKGGAGEEWALATGFRAANETVLQRLPLTEVNRSLWEVPVPEGYRLERWTGAAPEDLVASFATAKGAIHDAPRGEAALREPDWTVERVRAAEAEVLERRVEERAVVAVHEPTGEVAGLTQLWLHPRRPTWGYQRDTVVLAAHRGHGLGRAVKAHMLRRLVEDRPDLDLIYTGTNADNVHMAAVNHALGFTTVRSMVEVNQPVEALLDALAGVRR